MRTTRASGEGRGVWRRAAQAGLKVLGLFVILEPVWMLLPFAGFLYGSVLQIETLGRHPSTAWLTHFVFPGESGVCPRKWGSVPDWIEAFGGAGRPTCLLSAPLRRVPLRHPPSYRREPSAGYFANASVAALVNVGRIFPPSVPG
jgi:hypothetical protein